MRSRPTAGTAIALALTGAVLAGLWLTARDSRARVRVGDVLSLQREAFAHDPDWLKELETAGGGPSQELRVRVDDLFTYAQAGLVKGTLLEFRVKRPDGTDAWIQAETDAPLFKLDGSAVT